MDTEAVDTAVAAVNRLAVNRLEDKLAAQGSLLQQGLQTVRDDVKEIADSIKNLASKLDTRLEKHDDRIRVLEVSGGATKMLGLLFSLLVGPGLALLSTFLIWHLGGK